MAPDDKHEGDEMFSADEWRRIRARVHNTNDKMQGHALFIEEHRVQIQRLNEDVRDLRSTSVSQGQLVGLIADILELRTSSATRTELTAATSLHNLKIDALTAALGTMKEAQIAANMERKVAQEKTDAVIAKVAWFIILAVLGAVLGLVIANKGAIAKAATMLRPVVEVWAFGPNTGEGRR